MPSTRSSLRRRRLSTSPPTTSSTPASAATPSTTPESELPAPAAPRAQPTTSPTDPEPAMHATGARGRNLESLDDFGEKGLLRRTSSGDELRRRRETDESGADARVEAVRGDSEEAGGGLKSRRDQEAFALLILLCIPLGLTFGTLPFLLKPHLSYSQLAVFALSTWPYSLKLLWSPIVDAWFVGAWGRRKSWIVPVQAIVGAGMWVIGGSVEQWLEADYVDVNFITMVFGALIFAAATQDIAVDGWALTLLSPPNLSYASTAQTIGLGIGTALSFTVFLAFNSLDFSNKYFRSTPLDYPLVSLGGYLRFWAVVYIFVTVGLIFLKKEDPVSDNDPDLDVAKVYKVMWSIVRLKNIQSFLVILLLSKFGFQVNESVTQLKLLERGLSKEDMAIAVLLDFPAQMVVGWLAAKWSRPTSTPSSRRHPLSAPAASGYGVLSPWIYAFYFRLAMAAFATAVVYFFPAGRAIGNAYFALVVVTTLLSSLAGTVQFVGITAFHTQIADPLIGGTYMTLLNTVSNLGGTWPKPVILRLVDALTISHCSATGAECTTDAGRHACAASGGHCLTTRDGYYVMSAVCVTAGAAVLGWYVLPTVRRLQALPMSAWRVKIPT
ncbi:hypothetical protein Q5752_005070 [Cryptotrichosporon argae]